MKKRTGQVLLGLLGLLATAAVFAYKNTEIGGVRQDSGSLSSQAAGDVPMERDLPVVEVSQGYGSSNRTLGAIPIDLFPNRSLDGWEYKWWVDNRPVDVFSFHGDILVCKGQPQGYMYTKDTFKDFILEFDWRYNPTTRQTGEGGVLLRITGEPLVWPHSIEAQILYLRTGDIWTHRGFPINPVRLRTTGECTLKERDNENLPGEWNHYEIHMRGDKLTLKLNGQVVNEVTGVEDVAGHIGLQVQGPEIQYKNFLLTPLD